MSRAVRREHGEVERLYEAATPKHARDWIDEIARRCGAPLDAYIRECIVIRDDRRGVNLSQEVFSEGGRGILYGGVLYHLLSLVAEITYEIRRPALVQYGRRIASRPKQLVPSDQAVQMMLDEARVTAEQDALPQSARETARIIAAFRLEVTRAEVLTAYGDRMFKGRSHEDANRFLGFGIAHELAHHLLAHGARAARFPSPPGREMLQTWLASIGYEPPAARSASHKNELEADALAVLLLSGGTRDAWRGVEIAGMASSLILGISLLDDEMSRTLDAASSSHPSFRKRLSEILRIVFLGFDDVADVIRPYVPLGREKQDHAYNYVLQNIFVSQVVARLVDNIVVRRGGVAFGLPPVN